MEALLNAVYTDPRSPGSYGGLDRLYREAKKRNPAIVTRKGVREWAEKHLSYTLHKPARRKYPRNKVTVFSIDEVWQMDLCDMRSLRKHNDGAQYLLTVIDVFSKYAFVRVLENKRGPTVLEAFRDIVESTGRRPLRVHADYGSEFKYRGFNEYLTSIDSRYYITHSEVKASVIERFNRTLKTRMWSYFTQNNTYRYVDAVQNIVASYNASQHRSLKGRTPESIGPQNQLRVWKDVYSTETRRSPPKFKYSVGDHVRISRNKGPFEKGYTDNWSEEHFTIFERLGRKPPAYRLRDLAGEDLKGVFYEAELQRVKIDEDRVYAIEKVLRRRRGQVLVRWRGWPQKFDSWVPSRDVQRL